jgi:hypothetical protein
MKALVQMCVAAIVVMAPRGLVAEDAVKLVRVVLPARAEPVLERIAQVFARQVTHRCGARVITSGDAPLRVELAIQEGLGREGYSIASDRPGSIRITGNDERGVLYGVGRFLRTCRYDQGGLTPGAWRGTSVPKMPVRGIYFATHFSNYYHVAPIEEIQRYVEDLALWGYNNVAVWYDIHHFREFDDPDAVKFRQRLHQILQTARNIGMGVGLTTIANEGYSNSPKELRCTPVECSYGCEICPSKPGGIPYVLNNFTRYFDEFRDLQPEYVWVWPYDAGGCGCERCRPWGANGFLKAGEPLARLARQKFPGAKIVLATWQFRDAEWQGLSAAFAQRPDWVDYVMTDRHVNFPDYPLRNGVPGGLPLLNFPEISMHSAPWGGYGADPLPEYNERRAELLRLRISGGWPYSEGIYEDVSKFFWAQFYWNPQRTADEIHAEYATYYLGPQFAQDAVRLFRLQEKMSRSDQLRELRPRNLGGIDEAWELAQKIDSRLAPWAKSSWRWRIIHIRASIDRIAKNMRGWHATPEERAALTPLRDELERIYQGAKWVFPLPALPDPRNLSYLRPVTVSSTLPRLAGSAARLVDGDFGGNDPLFVDEDFDGSDASRFWAHDPSKEKTAWVCVDLGRPAQIQAVRVVFRRLGAKFAFVPSELRFEVSDDGKAFTPAGASTDVPKEGDVVAKGVPVWKAYGVGRNGRYLRVNLGVSQRKQPLFAGTLELTEIQVLGKRVGEPTSGGENK